MRLRELRADYDRHRILWRESTDFDVGGMYAGKFSGAKWNPYAFDIQEYATGMVRRVPFEDIYYIRSVGGATKPVQFVTRDRVYEALNFRSLVDIDKHLDRFPKEHTERFFRVNRKDMVNLNNVGIKNVGGDVLIVFRDIDDKLEVTGRVKRNLLDRLGIKQADFRGGSSAATGSRIDPGVAKPTPFAFPIMDMNERKLVRVPFWKVWWIRIARKNYPGLFYTRDNTFHAANFQTWQNLEKFFRMFKRSDVEMFYRINEGEMVNAKNAGVQPIAPGLVAAIFRNRRGRSFDEPGDTGNEIRLEVDPRLRDGLVKLMRFKGEIDWDYSPDWDD